MELGPDGRLVREGLELELNAYCRRAVSQGVELAAEHGGRVTVFTLGPPAAEDALREAIAWGLERDVDIDGVLVTDPAFAGSDTLATARALAAALASRGSVRPGAHRAELGRRRHRSGRPRAGRAARPALRDGRSRARHLRRRGPGALRARRRLGAGRGTAAGGAVDRRAPDRPVQGRARGPRRGARRPHPRWSTPPTSAPGRGARPAARPRSGRSACSRSRAGATSCPTHPSTSRCAPRWRSLVEQGALDRSGDAAPSAGVVPATGGAGPRRRRRRRARPGQPHPGAARRRRPARCPR